ncbi:acetyltransferase [Brevundimonas sp. NIBR11]|uniref:acetyltransferase n=1 Tax=Brevundimonas sp. NIBR11 TaxID=3015999 RepID=UPI0022F06AA3|nr:acetyltransferase [Brevundimonas sp. NIBR11]WGM32802.1 GDP-perosamine N-acetyltransferase [Brevundimonas sp. NIBR11]
MAQHGPTLGIIGTGGFAREVLPVARAFVRHHPQLKIEPGRIVFVDRDGGDPVSGVPILSEAEFVALEGDRYFTIAIGDGVVRQTIADRLEEAGCKPLSICAENVILPDDLDCGPGAVFQPFSMVTADARIGRQFQCNIYAYVAHDCVIGDHVTLAPRASLNGNVVVEDHVYVGTGAVIRQGTPGKPLVLGRGCVIGMGAVVTKDVAPGVTVIGNPARPLEAK